MKKNLFLLIFLILAAFSLPALEREDYMPSKLIKEELPADYPKELEELFLFYYNTITDIKAMIGDKLYEDSVSVTVEDLQTADLCKYNYLQKVSWRKYAYLHWLAEQTIPDYYLEYLWFTVRIAAYTDFYDDYNLGTLNNENTNSLYSLLSSEYYYYKLIFQLSPLFIITTIVDSYLGKEGYPLDYLGDRIWVKARILKAEQFVRNSHLKFPNATEFPVDIVIVKVIDSVYEKCPLDTVAVQVFSFPFYPGVNIQEKTEVIFPVMFNEDTPYRESLELDGYVFGRDNPSYLSAGSNFAILKDGKFFGTEDSPIPEFREGVTFDDFRKIILKKVEEEK